MFATGGAVAEGAVAGAACPFGPGAIVDGIDLDTLPREEIQQLLLMQAARVAQEQAKLTALAAAMERGQHWDDCGLVSLGRWLGLQAGLTRGHAEATARRARLLGDFPALGAEFAAGRLSASQVDTVLRVATPQNIDTLVGEARRCSATQLQAVCSRYRRAKQHEEAYRADHPGGSDEHITGFYAFHTVDDHGAHCGRYRLPAPIGGLLQAALDGARDELWRDEKGSEAEGPRPGANALAVQALGLVAETALATRYRTGGGADRHQVVVMADIDAVLGDESARAWMVGGGEVSHAELSQALCDGSIVTMLTREGTPLHVGRKRRTPTAAQRRALWARDGGCRWPGCTNRRFVDAHHVLPWEKGGPTDLWNLILLCHHHHHLLHSSKGFRLSWDPAGGFQFRNPRGHVIQPRGEPPPVPEHSKPPPTLLDLVQGWERANAGRFPSERDPHPITPDTIRPEWGGEPLTKYALDVLVEALLLADAA